MSCGSDKASLGNQRGEELLGQSIQHIGRLKNIHWQWSPFPQRLLAVIVIHIIIQKKSLLVDNVLVECSFLPGYSYSLLPINFRINTI